MKMIIIKIIIVLVAIISVILVIAMFTKKSYTLTREVVINKPKQNVFDFIKYNKNQPSYSKWLLTDPQIKIVIKGAPDGTPGNILTFDSKHERTGKGEFELKKINEGKEVDFEVRFLAPYVFVANGTLTTEAISENQTKLRWVYNSGMDYPKNAMLLFMDMDKIIGGDIAESLQNIKTILEK